MIMARVAIHAAIPRRKSTNRINRIFPSSHRRGCEPVGVSVVAVASRREGDSRLGGGADGKSERAVCHDRGRTSRTIGLRKTEVRPTTSKTMAIVNTSFQNTATPRRNCPGRSQRRNAITHGDHFRSFHDRRDQGPPRGSRRTIASHMRLMYGRPEHGRE